MGKTLYEFSARRLGGEEESLAVYQGQVVLVVNVASRCGYTPQYAELEKMWRELGPRGLTVLGFPCNQFGSQEPGDDAEIAEFCSTVYGVSFPMFAKIDVNGSTTHPLYAWLKAARPGLLGSEAIKWNFTKFVVGRDGVPVARHAPAVKPDDLIPELEALL